MDEAKKKKIEVDAIKLALLLGVPVIPMAARSGRGIAELKRAVLQMPELPPLRLSYAPPLEAAAKRAEAAIEGKVGNLNPRWTALRLLEHDESLICGLNEYLGYDITSEPTLARALDESELSGGEVREESVRAITERVGELTRKSVKSGGKAEAGSRLDKIFTGKHFAVPVMLAVLTVILWLTAVGANYPSNTLNSLFAEAEARLYGALLSAGAELWLCDMLAHGVFRVLGWVISVMLPPMAIFFPLFTLLEDFGYLPRIAFNLDGAFRRCGACGKQALTMCMGLGCNAVGVTGCRIIDSPREKLLAIVTNSFVPCNGRLPSLIAVIGMFAAVGSGALRALLLCSAIVGGIGMTLLVCLILSKTLLRGKASSFALELPPYRVPQVGRVIVRSIFDKSAAVLGRAAAVAAPAGLIIWLLANIRLGSQPLLLHFADFLNPLGEIMGLDGVILLGFILGFPANEIVLPLILMGYTAGSGLVEYESLSAMREILLQNGWNGITSVCFVIFMLFHFPCSTACITVYKETKSLRQTLFSMALPTLTGVLLCAGVSFFAEIFFC